MPRLQDIKRSSVVSYRFMLGMLASTLTLQLGLVVPAYWGGYELETALVIGTMALTVVSMGLLMHSRQLILTRIREGDKAEVERLALLQTDALTGAMSRRLFMEELKGAVRAATLSDPCALFLIDLDHFKGLNDTYGHNVGDFTLTRLVDVAKNTFPNAKVGRLGGDEFAVLLSGHDERGCAKIAAEFLRNLRQSGLSSKQSLHLTASVGIALAPRHTSFVEEMTLLADLALYDSKRQGRARATLFDPDMLRVQRYRRTIERDLRAAILLDELELHYQPVVSAQGETNCVEALSRWPHPTRGTIPPSEFIPVAEESDLIDMLGEWVLRRACRDFADLPGRMVSINISAAQLKRDDIVHMVLRVLRETGVHPRELMLEITENMALTATPSVLGRLQALRNEGIKIALDDFGTGHCGFNYLRNLPVDVIKIDRSYVSRIGDDPVSSIFITAVIETGRALGLTVLAEGVETEEEMLLTRTAGCALFQGYLIARPQPLRQIAGTNAGKALPEILLAS